MCHLSTCSAPSPSPRAVEGPFLPMGWSSLCWVGHTAGGSDTSWGCCPWGRGSHVPLLSSPGVNLLVGTENGLMLLDRSGQGKVYNLINRRRFQQMDVLEGLNVLVTISGAPLLLSSLIHLLGHKP